MKPTNNVIVRAVPTSVFTEVPPVVIAPRNSRACLSSYDDDHINPPPRSWALVCSKLASRIDWWFVFATGLLSCASPQFLVGNSYDRVRCSPFRTSGKYWFQSSPERPQQKNDVSSWNFYAHSQIDCPCGKSSLWALIKKPVLKSLCWFALFSCNTTETEMLDLFVKKKCITFTIPIMVHKPNRSLTKIRGNTTNQSW